MKYYKLEFRAKGEYKWLYVETYEMQKGEMCPKLQAKIKEIELYGCQWRLEKVDKAPVLLKENIEITYDVEKETLTVSHANKDVYEAYAIVTEADLEEALKEYLEMEAD